MKATHILEGKIKKEGDTSKVTLFYHEDTISKGDRALLLQPGRLREEIQKNVAEIRKTVIGQLLVESGKGVSEGKEYEDARLLAVNSIFNKQAFPRSVDFFQLMAASQLHTNMKLTTALEPLSRIGICASSHVVQQAETSAVAALRTFSQQRLTSVDIFDNCDYSQSRRDFAPEARPVFLNTVNMMQVQQAMPLPITPVWKPRLPGVDIDDWIDANLHLHEPDFNAQNMVTWREIEGRFDRGLRVARMTTAGNGNPRWQVLTPIMPGDEVDPTVPGDTGYNHSFGKPSEMKRVLGVLHRHGIVPGIIETRIGYGDEQAFETGIKLRFIMEPQ